MNIAGRIKFQIIIIIFNALLELYKAIVHCHNKKQFLFLDVSNAFNLVKHDIFYYL